MTALLGWKRCSKCGLLKIAEDFYKNAGASTGLSSYCCSCANQNKRESVARNPGKRLEQRRNYYITHREQIIAKVSAWTEAHPEKHRAYCRQSHAATRATLGDSYIRAILIDQNIPPLPHLIEVKRLQLQLHRKTHGQAR